MDNKKKDTTPDATTPAVVMGPAKPIKMFENFDDSKAQGYVDKLYETDKAKLASVVVKSLTTDQKLEVFADLDDWYKKETNNGKEAIK